MRKRTSFTREQGWHYALRLLNQRHYSEYMLKQKLRRCDLSEEDMGSIITKLRELRLLDDERYAEAVVRDHARLRHMSPRLIEQKLRHKGIPESIIEQSIISQQEDIPPETERAQYHAKRYRQRYQSRQNYADFSKKLAAYLYRKGFSSAVIYRVVRDCKREDAGGE